MMPLTDSTKCEEYLRNIWERGTMQTQERVYAVYLNHKGDRIFSALINIGSFSDTSFDRRGALKYALDVHSNYMVIAHNHPNGDCSPSVKDIETTEEIALALYLFDITLIDHIIITHDNYFSFKDRGMMKIKSNLLGSAMVVCPAVLSTILT